MTIAEMHALFRTIYDKIDAQYFADFTNESIDILLNEAISRFVKTRYSGNNNLKEGFQEIQKRTDDLNTLVKNYYLKPSSTNIFPLSSLYSNPTDSSASSAVYWIFLKASLNITKSTVTQLVDNVSLVSIDDLNKVTSDPFKRPTHDYPFIYFTDNSLRVLDFVDNASCNYIKLTCIVKPTSVSLVNNISSDLPNMVHNEIVNMAVNIALESTEATTRFQTNTIINKEQE
jgi:hypothetical protein